MTDSGAPLVMPDLAVSPVDLPPKPEHCKSRCLAPETIIPTFIAARTTFSSRAEIFLANGADRRRRSGRSASEPRRGVGCLHAAAWASESLFGVSGG